jgi:hypothetical protein
MYLHIVRLYRVADGVGDQVRQITRRFQVRLQPFRKLLLVIARMAGFVSLPLRAAGEQPSQQELIAQIRALKAKVDDLEAAQNAMNPQKLRPCLKTVVESMRSWRSTSKECFTLQ